MGPRSDERSTALLCSRALPKCSLPGSGPSSGDQTPSWNGWHLHCAWGKCGHQYGSNCGEWGYWSESRHLSDGFPTWNRQWDGTRCRRGCLARAEGRDGCLRECGGTSLHYEFDGAGPGRQNAHLRRLLFLVLGSLDRAAHPGWARESSKCLSLPGSKYAHHGERCQCVAHQWCSSVQYLLAGGQFCDAGNDHTLCRKHPGTHLHLLYNRHCL